MEESTLDPIKLVEYINVDTPLCVVHFVAKIFKINFNDKYRTNSTYLLQFNEEILKKSFVVTYPSSDYENSTKWRLILNPNTDDKWNPNSVSDGASSLIPYFNDTFIPPSSQDILFSGFGEKTNTNPFRINEIMAYKICHHFNYELTSDTSFDEMIYACKLFINEDDIPGIRRMLIENIKVLPDNFTIKLAYKCSQVELDDAPHEVKDEVKYRRMSFDESSISRVNQLMESATFLSQRMVPESNSEAIVMASIRFGICIAEASDPMFQYNNILKKKLTSRNIHKYVPVNDSSFMIKYTRNPNWFKLENNWFEELLQIYSLKELLDFAFREGYVEKSEGKSKEKILISFLKERKKINNFYFGRNPYCNKVVTYYLENIDEVHPDELICFGSIIDGNLEYLTVEELTDYFKSTKIFTDPLSKKCFHNNVLIKLKRQIDHNISNNLQSKKKYMELRKQIDALDEAKVLIDSKVRDLSNAINEMNIEDRNKINKFFDNVIEMAFYARGWKIDGMEEYPLKSEQCDFDRIKWIADVYDNTCLAYHKVMDSYNELSREIRTDIDSLNLITFADSGNYLHIFDMHFKNVSISRDLSLMECMWNCIHGNPELESSCIRTNSNYILFTASWYSMIFGFKLDFRIDKIEEIK